MGRAGSRPLRTYGDAAKASQMTWMLRHVRPCARAIEALRVRHLEGTGLAPQSFAVLEALADFGPQTVPDIARRRGVRRQAVQPLVDALAASGHVELLPNRASRRSKLVRLGEAGRETVAAVRRRESAFEAELAERFLAADIATTRQTLANLFFACTGVHAWDDPWMRAGYAKRRPGLDAEYRGEN